MLEQLRLENFKGHENLSLTFGPGLNLITGNNYSGKSSVLHGILFAFFGVSAVPGGSKIVPRRGLKPKDTRAAIQFYHAGDTYRVERKVAGARLYRGDKLIASSLSAVNKELEEVLNVPQRMFYRLKYAEQGQTQALLTMGIGELHKIIEHVSGVYLVNRVVDRASKLASAASSKLEVAGLMPDLQASKDRDQEMRAELTRLYGLVGEKKQEAETMATRLKFKNKELSEADRHNAQQARLESQHQAIRNQLKQAEGSKQRALHALNEYRPLAKQSNRLETQARELQELSSKSSKLEKDLVEATGREKSLKAKLDDTRTEQGRVEELLNTLPDPDESSAVAKREQAKAEAHTLMEKARTLQTAIKDSICPACKRPFEGMDATHLQNQLNEAENLLPSAKDRYSIAAQEADEVATQAELRKSVERSLWRLSDDVQSLSKALQLVLEQADKAKQSLALLPALPTQQQLSQALEQARASQRAVGAYRAADEALGEAQTLINKLNAELREIPPPESRFDTSELKSKIDALRQASEKLGTELSRMNTEYGRLYYDWEKLSDSIKRDAETARLIKELHQERDTANGLSKYLRDNRDRFMLSLWEQVTAYAGDFASVCTGGAVQQIKRTRDGSFQYLEDGVEAMIDGASGAQKSIMALGVQLALDTLLPDTFGALLLDEPTSQMDSDHSLAVTQALSQAGRQIIMVSHREMDASAASAHIHLS